jgi:rfaE bifunctional protein nucleotidyltransferase chain/domain
MKILDPQAARTLRQSAGEAGQTVVFTNGCFDVLHRGHVDLLARGRARGDLLIVGLNDDPSVQRLKGKGRPLNPSGDRAVVLAALEAVDVVILFGEDTPEQLIETLLPDILVKGADYREEDVVGGETVRAHGGKVVLVPLTEGRSTTGLVERLRGKG